MILPLLLKSKYFVAEKSWLDTFSNRMIIADPSFPGTVYRMGSDMYYVWKKFNIKDLFIGATLAEDVY